MSSLPRIYITTQLIEGIIIKVIKEHIFYLKTVLRLREGGLLRVFNENNGEFLAKVANASSDVFILKVLKLIRPIEKLDSSKIILALSLIKQDKMLDAVDMAVQLGVEEILPIVTARSQLKTINEQKFIKRIIEATEQSERFNPPVLHKVSNLTNFTSYNHGLVLYANEKENNFSIMDLYIKNKELFSLPIVLVIGPEGGFIEDELKLLSSFTNSYSVSLHSNILRTETAVAAGLSELWSFIRS